MKDPIEELRRELDEVRNLCRLKFNSLEQETAEIRAFFARVKSTLLENSYAHGNLGLHTLDLLERVARIEQKLKLSSKPARTSSPRMRVAKKRPKIVL